MPEHSDHTSAVDFLKSSALTARLLSRLTSSPGVIDIQDIFRTYARLTEWASHARLLLDDLLARYSIDDGSALRNLPLVTEQPGMLNLNTYLTNSNSFSSIANNSYSVTTNEFVSQLRSSSSSASGVDPSASTSLRAEAGLPVGSISKHELSHEVKTTQLDSVSSTQTSGKFRLRRKPGRVTTEMAVAVAQDVPRNPVSQPAQALTHHAGSTPRPEEEKKDLTAKAGDVKIAPNVDLPLAFRSHTPVQSERVDQELITSPIVSRDRESKNRRPSANQEPTTSRSINSRRVFSPLNRSTEITKLTLNDGVGVLRRLPDRSRLAILQEQIVSTHPQTVGAQAGQRQSGFVWRRNEIDRTVRELVSAVSDRSSFQTAQRAASGASTVQSPQNSQTVTPESVGRRDQRQDGVEITADEILRSISNTLLVERDRRGY